MQSKETTVKAYLESLPEERKAAMLKLRGAILQNIPQGFSEEINYGMIGYVVPHTLYPKGYHCDPKLPLPFIGIASQKNFIAVYHMGIYADKKLLEWFLSEYPKHCKAKLDMGKSCIRFKKADQIPYNLIGELAVKITPDQWILIYEEQFKKGK
ncbi:MAG: DUF1801 domain-containing protein [Bacteroidetes bacterium]|nr:DUF1801 domain-containing protein [Bacteroidota bacterium]HET6245005.1 DUF1801 domain-containing protein [Bacteroidia bacterium]